ncbi:MAG: sigma-70 family RNA polymerase sigma factor [Candidatus Solibacter sp.]
MSSFASDEQFVGLIRQEQTGTALQEQVSRLFEEAREDIYRYLLTLGLYPPQAQEATQEVFLRLYTTLRKGEDIQNPRAWIFRVAHNLGLKIRARQHSEEPFNPELRDAGPALLDTPESELLERERMKRFHSAVTGLSEQQRRVLFLRMEGLRYPEIAAALGISASAVGEFLRRAMLRLKKVRDE